MDQLGFLDTFEETQDSNAILTAVLEDGQVCHISDKISPFRFLDLCPLLYHAFEYNFQSRLQANIEAPSVSAVTSLLRYCYTGNYLPPGCEDGPILLLPHAEAYKMAEDFDVPELQLLAHGNFVCQVDFACSLPDPPTDLLETVRFLYKHCSSRASCQQQGLVNAFCNYCIAVFQYQKLGKSSEFLELATSVHAFRQDLCRTNIERNFEDECAFDIVRLALDCEQTCRGFRPTTLASRDLPQEMLFDLPHPEPPVPQPDIVAEPIPDFRRPLTFRRRRPAEYRADSGPVDASSLATVLSQLPSTTQPVDGAHFESDPSSEDEGFAMVRRPKPTLRTPPNNPFADAELVPLLPLATDGNADEEGMNEDEWTMI